MKRSIRGEISYIFFGILCVTLLGCWAINNFFLEQYYVRNKAATLKATYEAVDYAERNQLFQSPAVLLDIEEICENANLSVLVTDSSMKPTWASQNEIDVEYQLLYRYVYGETEESSGITEAILDENSRYTVSRSVDPRFDSDYLELKGILANGHFIIIRSAVQGIRENVQVSNRFLAYITAVIMLLSFVAINYFTDRITKPIRKLVRISEQMTQLNFEAKYPISKKLNEFDVLGGRMNLMSEKLEQTIADLKTANNELQSDIERKTQIDEMRKEFLSNVSHELKTPLALIQGYAEGLQECINDDPESREFYCEVIIDEAMKMNRMVKKLLTLNQLEFGQEAVVMERFDIVALIRGIVQSMTVLAEQKEVTVIFNEENPVYVWGDEYKIEEVVTNFMSNAFNHVDYERKIEVKIRQAEGVVRVSVFNTGNRIPAEDLDKIWIKFYKVDKARTREYGGNGIGLSIVKAIMDSMNKPCGVVNYENGVEFWFEMDANTEVV